MTRARVWRLKVAPYFDFLETEFGMAVIATDDHTDWETSVTYGGDATAVVVRYSVEFDRVEIELVRLVSGKIPDVPIFIHPDTPINRALIDDLLILRAPAEMERLKAQESLTDSAVEAALAFQAQALRRYALDFLNGDTAIFSDFDRLIKARVAGDPQTLKIHFPEGTPREEVARTVEQASHVDPQVPVEVHTDTGARSAGTWPQLDQVLDSR